MHLLPKMGVAIAICSIFLAHDIQAAYCARCVKIEKERAEQQAKNPQSVGYYDDEINLHSKELKTSEESKTSGEPMIISLNIPNRMNVPIPSESLSPAYSVIYAIFKTKNFLETLDGSFTLFVPTNQALNQLPPGMLADLSRPENQEKLAALISNHVVAQRILRKDFENQTNTTIKTISGKNLALRSKDGKWSVNGASVLIGEPAGYNGVIYLIDQIFLP